MKQKNIDMKHRLVRKPIDPNSDIYIAINKDISLNYAKYYKKQNVFTRVIRYICHYVIAKPLFYLYGKIFLGVKIHNKQNLKKIKGGAIVVSNHVHYMDWSITSTFIAKRHRTTIISLKENFKIPVARKLIEAYGCLPIPDSTRSNMEFYKCIKTHLDQKHFVHIFPEASLWPYYTKLRPFRRGAFYFAAKYDCPILPYVITFRKSTGIRKIWRREPRIDVLVGEPQYANKELDPKTQIEELKNRVYSEMQKFIGSNYEYVKYVPSEEYDELTKKTPV